MKIKKYTNLILVPIILFLFTGIYAQEEIGDIEKVIDNYPNSLEMKKVIHHFSGKKDSLKLKATIFLLENMKYHYSFSYFWADTLGNKIEFDELAYEDFASSVRAFDGLKNKYGKLSPIRDTLPDIETITFDFLINSINDAFNFYDSSMDFGLFCQYVLPYRISVEPISDWRVQYKEIFSKVINSDQLMTTDEKIDLLKENLTNWFVCTYGIEKRKDPLPLLSALQLLHRKKGPCEDVASLATLALRSLGMPSSVDIVPYWATSTGGHSLNVTFDEDGSPVHFDILSLSDSLHEFIREPAKVFRLTYSKNDELLASKISIDKIPPYGLLRQLNYIDVTHEYWPTRDVEFDLFDGVNDSTIVYACTFNGLKWRPVWWGYALEGKAVATNMCRGAVFLPKVVKDGKLVVAGDPIASGYKEVKILNPYSVDDPTFRPRRMTHTIVVKELEKYIDFKTGEKYALYFYDKKWRFLDSRTAYEGVKEMKFAFVPVNALLILRPKNSSGKERPFIITNNGERHWW